MAAKDGVAAILNSNRFFFITGVDLMHMPKNPIRYFRGDPWTIVEGVLTPPTSGFPNLNNTLLVAIPILLVLASLMGCAPAATPTATALPLAIFRSHSFFADGCR
jgi:hypothetical protein